MTRFDCAMFDMDGTLWDAVDTYASIWNVTNEEFGVDRVVDRSDLIPQMGLVVSRIFERIFEYADKDFRRDYLRRLDENSRTILRTRGGILYDGVAEGFRQMKDAGIRIILISNCGEEGLQNFARLTGLEPYVDDSVSYGQNHLSKYDNIRLMLERYVPDRPVYVGDTEGDCRSAHFAGIKMIHAAYGFGLAPEADYHAESFKEVVEIIKGDLQ